MPNGQAATDGQERGLKPIGGLMAVWGGLFVLLVLGILAMLLTRSDSSKVAAIAASSFGVIGTLIGAYFGVKVGTDGTATAVKGLQDQASKAAVYASYVDPGKASEAAAQVALGARQPAPAGGPPMITGVSPAQGPAKGGQPVTIAGINLSGASGVKFGSKDAAFSAFADTLISAVVPAGSAGDVVDVVATTSAGTSGTSAADRYTYS